MLKAKNILRIFKAKHFYMITLLFAWLLALIFMFDSEHAPNYSLHLSSNSSVATMAAQAPSLTAEETAAQTGKRYELQLRLLRDSSQNVGVISDNGAQKQVVLKKGTLITVNTSGSAFPWSPLNPATLNANNIDAENLKLILSRIQKVPLNQDVPYADRSEAIVTSAKDKKQKRELVGETVRLNLNSLALKLEKIEEAEDIDYGADEEAVSSVNSSEGRVSCLFGNCPSFSRGALASPINFDDILSNILGRKEKPEDLKTLIEKYENSAEVKELMSAAYGGYTAVRKDNGRIVARSYPKAPRVSGSIGACYNGVKVLLTKGDMIDTPLVGNAAKTAGPQLEKNGFINLMEKAKDLIKSPYDAPKGSVLVYEGYDCPGKGSRIRDGGCPYGHIEVRTDTGFISDYFSTRARTGDVLAAKRRRLIGVYIKSNTEMNHVLALNNAQRGLRQ